jgi:hypothetical protein
MSSKDGQKRFANSSKPQDKEQKTADYADSADFSTMLADDRLIIQKESAESAVSSRYAFFANTAKTSCACLSVDALVSIQINLPSLNRYACRVA